MIDSDELYDKIEKLWAETNPAAQGPLRDLLKILLDDATEKGIGREAAAAEEARIEAELKAREEDAAAKRKAEAARIRLEAAAARRAAQQANKGGAE